MTTTAPQPLSQIGDAALRAAAGLTGMDLVYLATVTPDTTTWTQLRGSWDGVTPGMSFRRTDTFCHRMLAGAPPCTSDAAHDPQYAEAPLREKLGVGSYVGVPVVTPRHGVVGTLAGISHGSIAVDAVAISLLRAVADEVGLAAGGVPSVRLSRGAGGWQVEQATSRGVTVEQVEDAVVGMTLADLLVDDVVPPARPKPPIEELDETAKLRLQITQLEHALSARVVIEQAIGVLAERHSVAPREAFERLRRVARSRGRRVHDVSRLVVASASRTGVDLPRELR